MRRALLLSLAILVGCASTRGRADDHFERGDYLHAAELYDQVVRQNPNDAEARKLRDTARAKALEVMAGEAKAHREAQRMEDAATKVDQLLSTRETWGFVLDKAAQEKVKIEVDAAGTHVLAKVMEVIEHPLVAESIKKRHDKLLRHQELSHIREDLGGEIVKAGRAHCEKLAKTATSPYWSHAVNAYCTHFGGHLAALPELPDVRSGISVAVQLDGVTDTNQGRLRADLASWFGKTRWYSDRSKIAGQAQVLGRLTRQVHQRRVQLTRNWQERIAYQDIETYQDPYQEAYTDTEYYSESVPYTDYEYSGGRSRPVTKYRTESRRRTVTKYRTAYRTATRPVTRYRYEQRVFNFEADDVTGDYTTDVMVRVDLGAGLEPFAVKLAHGFQRRGLYHDVSFEPAGVAPERPPLLDDETFFRQEEQALEKQFFTAMSQRWLDVFCASPTYELEPAARCLYANPKPPPAATAALQQATKDDVALLAQLMFP